MKTIVTTADLPLNGAYFGRETVAVRNLMAPSFEPCAALVGCVVRLASSPMFAPPAHPFGVVVRIGRGFFGEPVAVVRDTAGAEHEGGNIYPEADPGRGPIGWHLCRADAVPEREALVLYAMASTL